jgi:hypothetical protein
MQQHSDAASQRDDGELHAAPESSPSPSPTPTPSPGPSKVISDFSTHSERTFYGDDPGSTASPSRPSSPRSPSSDDSGGSWYTHRASGVKVRVPAGFVADENAVPGATTFAGVCGGTACWVYLIAGEPTGLTDQQAEQALPGYIAGIQGTLVETTYKRWDGAPRLGGIADFPTVGARGEFVVYRSSKADALLVFASSKADFEGTAAFRSKLFSDMIRMP